MSRSMRRRLGGLAAVRPRSARATAPPMNQKSRQELEDRIRSRFCADMIGAMPEPAIVIGADGRLAAANEPARALLPAMKLGDPLVLALRAPDVLDGLRRVMA